MKKFIVIWMCGCGIFAFGQEVNKDFTKQLLNEQFDNVDNNWNTTFNADNLFIGQNGFYELYRRSKKSGYYVFSSNAEEYSSFQLEVSLVFSDHDNNKQSAGILMMARSETSEGLAVQINRKREYRIVRVFKDKQEPISGSGSGWQKASALTKSENIISIRTYDKVYDLYLNGIFIQSFTDIELKKGKLALYVGPDSKVKFDYLKVLGEDKKELVDLDMNDIKSEEQAFTQIIVKLKDQINRKDKELDEMRTKLKLCENGSASRNTTDTGLYNQKNRLQATVIVLEEENEELKFKLLTMEDELIKLRDFRQGVEKGTENGDIIINLTNMVSNQKVSIETLEKHNKVLNDENNSLFMETKDLTKQVDKLTNNLSMEQQKNKTLLTELDSLKKELVAMKDSLSKKNAELNRQNGTPPAPEKELTEEEKLKIMIEKEREERRKKKEEEERIRKEEEEKKGEGTGG
jgi:hypothetical protein